MAKQKSFAPSADANARVLILGSMPGAESLRQQQYYAFRHNAFWRIMGELYGFPVDTPYPQRLEILKAHRIALWDVLAECDRPGSLDSSIRAPRPNDIRALVRELPHLEKILCNGGAARNYLRRFFPELAAEQLPSTSPAAARFTYAQKLAAWQAALAATAAPESRVPVRDPVIPQKKTPIQRKHGG